MTNDYCIRPTLKKACILQKIHQELSIIVKCLSMYVLVTRCSILIGIHEPAQNRQKKIAYFFKYEPIYRVYRIRCTLS